MSSCVHCMGGRARGPAAVQQGSNSDCRVVFWWYVGAGQLALYTISPPSEPGNLFLLVGLHRAGYQVTPPHRRTDGAGFINPGCGPQRKARTSRAGQGGLLLLLLRPPGWGPFRAGGGRSCLYAMRCGARALKLSLGPHAAVAILVLGRSEYWVATQTTESRR